MSSVALIVFAWPTIRNLCPLMVPRIASVLDDALLQGVPGNAQVSSKSDEHLHALPTLWVAWLSRVQQTCSQRQLSQSKACLLETKTLAFPEVVWQILLVAHCIFTVKRPSRHLWLRCSSRINWRKVLGRYDDMYSQPTATCGLERHSL